MMETNTEITGKIDQEFFKQLVQSKCGKERDNIVQKPAYGVDTSIIDLGNGSGLAVSSDPLSLIPSLGLKESAWLTVHLMANDIATTGFAPEYVQFVLNLPSDFSTQLFKEYWQYVHQFCKESDISITGGHTGGVHGQQSTTPGGGTMFVQASLNKLLTSANANAGDAIVVTKESALAATSILAKSFPKTVQMKLGDDIYHQAAQNFYRTSVLPEALAAANLLEAATELNAMHDVTEGGVLGAIVEMAHASGCGFYVYNERIPVNKTTVPITDLFGIDHRISLGAGSMIMAVRPERTTTLIDKLQNQDIPAVEVGKLTENGKGFKLNENGTEKVFEFNGEDPYWNAFYKAMEEGWK